MAGVLPNVNQVGQSLQTKLSTHEFTDKILGMEIRFFVLKMKDSFMLWIGGAPIFEQLAVAMLTPYSQTPMASAILGNNADMTSHNLAMKLSKKTGKQVFVSYNLPQSEALLVSLVETRLLQEIKIQANKFT